MRRLDKKYGPGMRDLKRWRDYIPLWERKVREKCGGIMQFIFGFVDVNCRPISRPSPVWVGAPPNQVKVDLQRYFYSGYTRCHVVKFHGYPATVLRCRTRVLQRRTPGAVGVCESYMSKNNVLGVFRTPGVVLGTCFSL